jgi:hypothetical protein
MAHKKHKRFYAPSPAAPMQKRASEPREYTYFSPAQTSLWSGRGASTRNAYQSPLTREKSDALNRLYRQQSLLHRRNATANHVRRLPSQLYMPQPTLRPSLPSRVHLAQQRLLCRARFARRAVLFALSLAGKGAGGVQRKPNWTEKSYISCK